MIDHDITWRRELDSRVAAALAQIAWLQNEMAGEDVAPEILQEMYEPYTDILREIYQEEYPLAQAIEESDLVVRLKGEGVDKDSPRLSVISSYFTKVRKQVTSLAKALANIEDRGRVIPKQFDLTLTAYARGSVVMGFSLPTIEDLESDGRRGLYGENEPLYVAARQAMKTLGVVSQVVSKGGSLEEVAVSVPDAQVRDVALTAVKELAPSGRQGITSVSIGGKDIGGFNEGRLTQPMKKRVREELETPVIGDERITIAGQIREMDLDAKRFELRHIDNEEINSVRCKYNWESDAEAKRLLDRYVIVTGPVERDAKGRPRLMSVEELTQPKS